MRLTLVILMVSGLCRAAVAAPETAPGALPRSGTPSIASSGRSDPAGVVVLAQNELSSKGSGGGDGGGFEVELCNRSRYDPLFSAIAWYKNPEDDDITIKGWFKLTKGECKTFHARFGGYQKIKFAYYAEWKHGERIWPANGDWKLCLEKEKAFERYNSDNYTCQSREKLVEFDAITVERDQPSRTINLK